MARVVYRGGGGYRDTGYSPQLIIWRIETTRDCHIHMSRDTANEYPRVIALSGFLFDQVDMMM